MGTENTPFRLPVAVVCGFATVVLLQGMLWAQGMSMESLGQSSPATQTSGNPLVPVECVAYAWSPYWDDQIYLSVNLDVDGVSVGSDTFPGVGDVSGTINEDVEIDKSNRSLACDASYWTAWGYNGGDSDSGTLAGRMVNALSTASETFQYSSPGIYLRTRIYEARDQYETVWNYEDPVEEYYDFISNGCHIDTITVGQDQTNLQGRFQDEYGDINYPQGPGIPYCQQDPSCTTSTRQFISVAGVWFDHNVDWSCTDVIVSR